MAARRKRQKWLTITIVVLLLVAAAAAGVFWLRATNMAGAEGSEGAAIVSVSATTGSVSTTVTGTGNVEDSLVDVIAPLGLTIDAVLVEAGDAVEEIMPLASLSTSSVSAALNAANSELETIANNIYYQQNGCTTTNYVLSHNYATVRQLNITEDSSASKVMAANGALVVLELVDGGELSVKNHRGTVAAVYVAEGSVVYNGSYLFALSEPQVSASIEELETQRAEKLALIETLSTLLTEPTLYCGSAGTISSVQLTPGAGSAGSAGGGGSAGGASGPSFNGMS
jgi:multidrug efflux pump subunit AcrA (membrane-fusion protein)